MAQILFGHENLEVHTWPTDQRHGTAHPRPHQPRSDLRLARGSLSRALRGPSARGKLRLARVPLGRLRWRPNLPTGRGVFTRQPLRGVGRVSDGVGRRQLASATMPHSGHDRRLLNLRPPLCCYSRRGAGLRRTVRTYLSPSATVLPTPCTFSPLQDPWRAWAATLRHSTAFDRGKTRVYSTLDAPPHPT